MRVSGTKLRAARQKANLTQPQLAERLTQRLRRPRPISFVTVSRWENHIGPTEVDVAVAIAAECGIGDFRELLEEDDEDEEDGVTVLVPLTLNGDLLRRLARIVAAARKGEMVA